MAERGAGVIVNVSTMVAEFTEGTKGMREAQGYLASLAPARRLGTAQEIAAAIVYLASPEAAFTNGVVLPVDGGRVAV
jgi:gluconate 5-dehydrogenase